MPTKTYTQIGYVLSHSWSNTLEEKALDYLTNWSVGRLFPNILGKFRLDTWAYLICASITGGLYVTIILQIPEIQRFIMGQRSLSLWVYGTCLLSFSGCVLLLHLWRLAMTESNAILFLLELFVKLRMDPLSSTSFTGNIPSSELILVRKQSQSSCSQSKILSWWNPYIL